MKKDLVDKLVILNGTIMRAHRESVDAGHTELAEGLREMAWACTRLLAKVVRGAEEWVS